MIVDAFLPLERFFGGLGTYLLWASVSLIFGGVVVTVGVLLGLALRLVHFLIKR